MRLERLSSVIGRDTVAGVCGGGTKLVAGLGIVSCVLLAGCSEAGNGSGTTPASTPPAPPVAPSPSFVTPTPTSAYVGPSVGDPCIGADIGRRATDANGTAIVCDNYVWVRDVGQPPRHPWTDDQRQWTDCLRSHTEAECRYMLGTG